VVCLDENDVIDTYTVKLGSSRGINIPRAIKSDFEELFKESKRVIIVKSSMGFIPLLSVYPEKDLEERIVEIIPEILSNNGRRQMRYIPTRVLYDSKINKSKTDGIKISIQEECLDYAHLNSGEDYVVLFLRQKHLEIWRKDVYEAYEELIQRGTNVLPVPHQQAQT